MQRIISIVLALAFVLSACTTPQGAVPLNGGIQPYVMGWNLNNQDPQVAEILMNNNDVADSRSAFQSYLDNGGKVDLHIDCADGRIDAGSQFYAGRIAGGGVAPYRFEIGSLAGQVTPEMIAEINKWIDRGWIRSINISSHTCEGGTCGAQGVKLELQSGKPVSDFEAHGLGDAARWINEDLDSALPTEQVSAQASKVFYGTNMRVPVFGWVADHATQKRELVAELYSGLDPNETAIRDELVRLNKESAAVLAPQAQAEGLGSAQHFRHIIITQGEIPFPVEMLAGLPEAGLDQAFNASIVISQGASEEQIVAALASAKAALQYGLAYSTSETEVLFFFEDNALLGRFLAEIKDWKVWQDFLANTKFQEVVAFSVSKTGTITGSLLVKPAYTAVSSAMTIGPNFRSNHVSMTVEYQGKKWAVIHGDDPATGNAVMVTITESGEYKFARVFQKYPDAKFWLNGNLAGEPHLEGLFSIAKWGVRGGIVFSPDFGEDPIAYLARTGKWDELPRIFNEAVEYATMKADLGFASTDLYHIDNILYSEKYGIHIVDWSPIHTVTGETMIRRFGSPEAYALYVQRDFGDLLSVEAHKSELLGLGYPIRQYLPIQWSGSASNSFYFTGSQTTIASEQVAAFERTLVNLGSTSPETVAEARNWLAANGAVQIDGQWVIFGQRSMLSSGPIRFANLTTYYPDGAKAFVGWQSSRFGVFGFERAENVLGGVGGWRVYAPSLEQVGVKLNELAPTVAKFATIVWVGFVASDLVGFSEQTEYMMDTSPQVLQPPITPSAYMWFPNEKTPYVATRWEISLSELQSGCNGTGVTADVCGAYLPEGQRSPIALVGALAGEYLPQQSWPSFGLDGNNVLLSWEYMREGSTVTVWHNGQMIDPGSSLDYYEPVMTQDGLWLVPYHAEYQTAACAGFCIQQAHGGEELRFLDGAQPTSLDLCPVDYATGSDPCVWRP